MSFKKDEAIAHGVQALDLKLPFGEMEVLQENLDLIKMELGVEHVEVLSAIHLDDLAKAGPLVSLLNQSPPSPGNPTHLLEQVRKTGCNRGAIVSQQIASLVYVISLRHILFAGLFDRV